VQSVARGAHHPFRLAFWICHDLLANMNKYRKVMKPRETMVKDDDEIRVTAAGSVSAYVSRAAKLFNEMERPYLTITATGNALTKAVTAAQVIKRRFKGLHQITKLDSHEIEDVYEPLEEGLDKVTDTRNVPMMEIKLSKEPLDKSDIGYQEPIDESLVTEVDPEELMKGRGRAGGKGKGRSKGKGKGKSKSRSKSRDQSPGKSGKSKGKGKGGGKGKGKREPSAKGGKGKGKSSGGKGKREESKGKGGGKSKGSKSGWDDYSYSMPSGKSKGKGANYDTYESYGSKGGKFGKSGGKAGGKSKGKAKGYDKYDNYSQSYGGYNQWDWNSYGKGKGGKDSGKGKGKKGWH